MRRIKSSQLKGKDCAGFTLVELLIVIAIIGVLAAIVVAALDPGEQIRRANDAKAKDQVNTIGNAAQNAYTASGTAGTPTYPKNQTVMASAGSGDLKAPIFVDSGGTEVINSTKGYCGGRAVGSCATGVNDCTNAPGLDCQNMIAYHQVTSKQSINQAVQLSQGAYSPIQCTPTTTYFAYTASSTITKAGFYCGGSPPGPGQTVYSP